MTAIEIGIFGILLLLALVALLHWKRRRDQVHERLNQHLRDYVAHTPPAPAQTDGKDASSNESLITAR
jgi:LPXTG-motif cell wall-anchored protein